MLIKLLLKSKLYQSRGMFSIKILNLAFGMQMYCFLIFFVLMIFAPSCRQKKNVKLAKNFYKLAMVDLADDVDSKLSLKKALQYVEKSIEQDHQPLYLAMKATILFRLNQYDESKKFFKLALNSCKDKLLSAEIFNNYACLLASTNGAAKAVEIWKKLENDRYYLTPEVALLNQGKVYAQNKDLKEARDCFSKSINIRPDFVDSRYYLSLVDYWLGNFNSSKDEVKTVLYLEPNHEGASDLAKQLGISIA
jgi:Tfp pilus assembly protein PilF